MAADDWAIVIGITYYPNLDKNARPLQGAHLDAHAFYDWLLDSTGGAVPPENATLILWPPGSDVAKARGVHGAIFDAVDNLRQISKRNAERGDGKRIGRRLYLYMSGHGFSPREDQTALAMPNVDADCVGPGYHWLGEYTADLFYFQACFDEVLLFMDCCRTTVAIPALNEPWGRRDDLRAYSNVKAFYAFAAKRGLTAHEQRDPAGNMRGVFTTALLAGLCGGVPDPPSDDRITTGSLRDYLTNILGSPGPEFTKADPIEVCIAQRIYPVTIHLSPHTGGRQVQVRDQRFVVVADTLAVPPVWQLSLKPGHYEARIKELGLEQPFAVQGTGAVVDVQL